MKSNTSRIDKINSELKKEISDIIFRKLKNPLISAMVSITDVDTSKDLSYAKVYVSIFSTDENKKTKTFEAILKDAWKIRKLLASEMRLRVIPELSFTLDESMEYGDKMDKLLNNIVKGNDKSDNT